VTLFALIFSIGILVDDAIVVVENIAATSACATGARSTAGGGRRGRGRQPDRARHLHVIAAILPLAFVGGLMART